MTWKTGPLERSGASRYTHLVRGDDDPDRLPRKYRKGKETAWKGDLKAGSQTQWEDRILDLVQDGESRTFNAICLAASDGNYTADVCFEKAPDKAIWALVEAEIIEHTMEAPIQFRFYNPNQGDLMAKAKTAKEKLRDVVKAHNAKVTNPKPKKLKKPTKAEQKRLAEKAAPKKAAVKIPKKKTCRTCKKTKVVKTKDGATNFWKNARSKDGLRDQCKDCFYDYRKAAQDAEDETDAG